MTIQIKPAAGNSENERRMKSKKIPVPEMTE